MVIHHIVLQDTRHITRVEVIDEIDFDVGEPLLIDWRTPQCASDEQIDSLMHDDRFAD